MDLEEMATHIKFIMDRFKSPADYGYIIVPLYGDDKIKIDHRTVVADWIDRNLNGCWTTFSFGSPTTGQGYCFLDEEDALAFKLRWS